MRKTTAVETMLALLMLGFSGIAFAEQPTRSGGDPFHAASRANDREHGRPAIARSRERPAEISRRRHGRNSRRSFEVPNRSAVQVKEQQVVARLDVLIKELEKSCKSGSGGLEPNPTKPLADSINRQRPGGSGPLHDAKEGIKQWGTLPAKQREQILSPGLRVPGVYETILQSYYNHLAGKAPEPLSPGLEDLLALLRRQRAHCLMPSFASCNGPLPPGPLAMIESASGWSDSVRAAAA